MALTEIKIRNTKCGDKIQKISDGGGLFLLLHPNGGKYWRWNYRFDGKQKTLSFGTYPLISLAEARKLQAKRQKQEASDGRH